MNIKYADCKYLKNKKLVFLYNPHKFLNQRTIHREHYKELPKESIALLCSWIKISEIYNIESTTLLCSWIEISEIFKIVSIAKNHLKTIYRRTMFGGKDCDIRLESTRSKITRWSRDSKLCCWCTETWPLEKYVKMFTYENWFFNLICMILCLLVYLKMIDNYSGFFFVSLLNGVMCLLVAKI